MNAKPALPDEETCWQAVTARDAAYSGVFFFAVRSTGIYCRPNCPARRPRRGQVTFFATPDEAEAAGYRPCKRCQPRARADPAADLASRVRQLIESSPEALTLAELGRRLGISPFHLQRIFKAVTGLTPRQYAAAFRANRFKEQARGGADVTTALYEAGYGASSRLYESAPAALGMTPAAYRSGGNGMTIYYTLYDSALGRLLVAATATADGARGVCSVSLGDDDETLRAALTAEFPAAQVSPVSQAPAQTAAQISAWASALVEHLSGARPRLDLPLDVLGTAFQQRVWAELRRIPYGETRTYTQVAQAIGQPSAVRAVARACATNPAALITPCHRVIRSDGSMGGYRWGLQRKEALLEREKRK